MWLLVIFSLFIFLEGLSARLQITQKGMDSVNAVATDFLSKNVKTMKITTHTGRGINVDYKMTDMRIRRFQLGRSSISRYTGNSLRWIAERIDLDIDGLYQYQYRKFSEKYTNKGRFTANVPSMSFKIDITLETDRSGRPTSRASQCSHTFRPMKYVFQGGKDWIIKLFERKAIQAIGLQIQENICGILKDFVEKNAQRIISNVKVKIPVGNSMMVDYSFLSVPSVSTNYLEVYFKIGYRKSTLNTTCAGNCIGKLIPQIAKSFPNCSVELHITSTKQPVTNIGSIFSVTAEGNISVYVRELDNSLHYLFKVSAIGGSKVNPRLNNDILYGQLARTAMHTNLADSVIGAIDEKALQFIEDDILTPYLAPMISGLCKRGFPLPTINNFQFVQPALKLRKNAILIETNLKYIPKSGK